MKQSVPIKICLGVLGIVFSLSAMVSKARATEPAFYNDLYPYYGEICAVSKITKKEGVKGGIGGHGVLYLKGACRDTTAPYPQIKFCDQLSTSPQIPDEAGVGISVDAIFKNVNWIAVESRSLFFDGGVAEGEPLTQEKYDHAHQWIKDHEVLRGVKFTDDFLGKKPLGASVEEYVLREITGTEFALSFGRHVYCTRVPLKREMLDAMVQYLNGLNALHFLKEDYQWNGLDDNCVHPLVNAFSAAGLWDEVKTNKFILEQLFNLALPSNEFINATVHGNDRDLDDPLDLFFDSSDRESLLKNDWLPTHHGYVTSVTPMHQFENQLYDDEEELLILNFPLLGPNKRRFNRITKEPRYMDVETNLRWFLDKYESALQDKPTLSSIIERSRADVKRGGFPLDHQGFRDFYKKYEDYLRRQIADVDLKLIQIVGMAPFQSRRIP